MARPSPPTLSILNGRPRLIPGPTLLHELVPFATNTENLAIDFLEDGIRKRVSYQSLHALSDILARRVATALATMTHACPVVPIFLPQCPELYIAILAILKAGKAFCPFSLDTPPERLDFMLGDLDARVVVTTSVHASDVFAKRNVVTILMDHTPADDNVTVPSCITPASLAYVLYTSGSTGLPKAVGVSHQAATQSLLAHGRHIPDFTRFLQFAAPTFDVSIFEIFFTLFRGRTIAGCSRSRMLSDLPAVIQELQVDAAELTPTVIGNLLQGRASVPCLKLLLTIGEMLTRRIIEEFGGDSESQSILWGMYGPTEAAIHCTLQAEFQKGSAVGNIGYPLDTVSAFIAKPTSEGDSVGNVTILPIGEVGELVVGGHQLADGYLNRPELTAAAFVQHPEFGRLYRTGDKARLLPNGTLECLGRITSGQVKLKGQRVELGEIEQYISKKEDCLASIVLVIDDILVAFCTVRSASPTREHIIADCKRWLPSYMVPADIVFLQHMPQSASGKVDRNALRSIYLRERVSRELPTPPESPPNSPVYQVIQEVLGRPIPLRTPLAFLGLDSLRSIRVASLLRARGYHASAADVLSASTIEDLVSICESTIGKTEEPQLSNTYNDIKDLTLKLPAVERYRESIADIIPCTPLQEAMLAESLHRPGAYCNWIEFELSTFHSLNDIRNYVNRLVKDNEILRSGFTPVRASTGSFSQIIWKELDSHQFMDVQRFSREYTLDSDENLLRPFSVQVNVNLPTPRLLFQIHHALYDGWSVDLLLCDLSNLLQGKTTDSRPQYRQVVEYYNGTQYIEEAKNNTTYWSRQLDGYTPNNLPNFNGKRINAVPVARYSRSSTVDTKLLHSRAQEYSVNPQVFFQAAVIRMMSFFLGSTDVVIGTVTSGRTIPLTNIEKLVGPCIASLPLRIDLAGCSNGLDVVQKIQKANRDMIQHCTLPLKDILKICGFRPGTQIFDVLFVWQETLFSSHQDGTVKVVDSADTLEYKLTLEFEPLEDRILSKATYDPSQIPESSIRYLLAQVDDIVGYLLNADHKNFDKVEGCFSPENLSIANPVFKSKPIEHSPTYAVERRAIETPDQDAILLGARRDGALAVKERFSYRELNERANRLAHALAGFGLQDDELIGVIMEKSIDLYVAILAALKSGHGYLPIVPDSPAERTGKILADAGIRICISERAVSEQIRSISSCEVIELDLMDLSVFPNHNRAERYNGSNIAYAVYTSGSTGVPKGVLVTQDNLMSNIEYLYGIYPTSSASRLLQACSQAFDVSVFEIFFTWYAGMCLCTATKDDLFSDLEHSINVLGVTHLSLTPTVASLVNPERVPNVQFLVTAGEALTEQVRRQWAGKGLYQGYGPSETTNICTVRGPFTKEDLINNIGPPFENTSAFILDPEGEQILPRGAVGELCFGGMQVFRGYMNDPELTAKKIIDHPQYGRLYRSGDMGILLPDDSILFTSRIDDQVKLRGQRVELGEITSNILVNSKVQDCVTLLFQLEDDSQRLVAFWVPKNATKEVFEPLTPTEFYSTIAAIYDSLISSLPHYMIPTHLVPISKIPQTAQSKVDKRLLYSTYRSFSNQFLEPAAFSSSLMEKPHELNDRERLIAGILADIVKVPPDTISPTTSFFNLGLDSLSAVNFSRELRNANIADVPVSFIMKHSTIASLSANCPQAEKSRASSATRAKQVQDVIPHSLQLRLETDYSAQNLLVENILPCTPLQEAMLSRSIDGRNLSYCNTTVFSVSGDIHRLQECWMEMFKRHQILRTAFVSTDELDLPFVQVVLGYEPLKCEEFLSCANSQAEISNSLLDLLQSGKPPVRLMTRNTDSSNQLILCCHHALYDGVAMEVLMKEIEQTYRGEKLAPPVPYEKYLYHVVCQDFVDADRFWELKLANVEPTNFPSLTGNRKAATPTMSISISSKALRTSLSEASRFSQSIGVSLLSVIQATWAKLLYFYTGEEDMCFGNVVSGRTLPEDDLDRVVGPCFNTVPVCVNTAFEKSNTSIIKEIHGFGIDAMPYQLTPLRRIQGLVHKGQGSHLFNTIVLLQQPTTGLDKSIWTLDENIGDMELPVVCEVLQAQERDLFELKLHHDTSLISNSDAMIVLETFDYALQSLIKFPDASAKDTIGFPPELLANANADPVIQESARSEFLHSAFESNVVARPGHPALDFMHPSGSRTTWSFEYLNALSNQIAHCLISQGIGPEDIVPIHMIKSPQFYASILGVLKAGAAFTPFNPDLPKARKQFMFSELSPKAVFCVEGGDLDWCPDTMIIKLTDTQQYSTENPTVPDLAPTNLAYCLYTSGSTGVPKAVSVEHRSPIQTIQNSRYRIPWSPESRLLQYAATTFDMCYYDCFIAWSFGFTLCAGEQAGMLDDLPSVIRSLEVDLLDLTPSVAASLNREDVPSVKWLYCIGEAMSADVVNTWSDACVNSYGPTEAAFCTTIFPVEAERSSNIFGKPFPSTTFTVVPKSGGEVLPIFGIGELYIGGAQLARGYHNRPDLTKERFALRGGKRYYKSGDMVRMLSDGNFEFFGRADDQVKIRGLRVELGEINNVIQGSNDRIQSVTTQILQTDARTKHQLVAFLVAGQSDNGQQAEIKRNAAQAAANYLPAYMVPQFYIFLDHIPRSPAGKIDKKALASIFRSADSGAHEAELDESMAETTDWTETESQIREIFAKISGTPARKINRATTIYQLGLDSISAVQVAAALRKRGFAVTVSNVLKYMNCRTLGRYLDDSYRKIISDASTFDFGSFDQKVRPDIVRTLQIADQDIEGISPCTPLQKGMVSQFLSHHGSLYFNYIRLQLHPDIDLRQLQSAWSATVKVHRMLRTGFAHVDEPNHAFVMIHYKESACQLPWKEESSLKAVPAEDWLTQAAKSASDKLHQPPWRVRAVEEKNGLMLDLAIFHALYDAQSLNMIFDNVVKAYKTVLTGSPTAIEPVISTILNLSSVENTESRDFWKRTAPNIGLNRFPDLSPLRYAPAPPSVLSHSCEIPLRSLEKGCRESNITLQAAGIAAWMTLLSAYTGEASATCGVVLSGRSFDTAQSVVFPCITTVPLVCTVDDDKKKMLKDIMALNAEIQQHQFIPLNDIQTLTGHPNEPLFDTLFTFQKLPVRQDRSDLWRVVDEKAAVEYPISIELEPEDEHLQLRLTFLPHLVPEPQASLILNQLERLIMNFVLPETITGLEEYDKSLFSITPPKEPTLPSDALLLHELVEYSAARTASKVALEFATSVDENNFQSRTWTYAQLDSEGNKIAQLLISHGARPGSLIAICFDKCPEAYFAILGILKAGCAFVALDPGAPVARKSYIVQDSGAWIVLSMSAQSRELRKKTTTTVIDLDSVDLSSTPAEKPMLIRAIDPQDSSYCLYTSGTTGTPKGCEITHENAVQALTAFRRIFSGHWNADSHWLQFASFHFDVCVLEMFWSWCVGIRLVSAPRDVILDDLARTINALQVTHIDLTPSLARLLHPDEVPSLCRGVFITGGESLKQEILDVWGPKAVIYNGYGPTEATIGVTMYPRVPNNGKPSNIGPQFDNVGSFLLKPSSEIPVLRGGVGELCVSGKLVGKGYLNRPELTMERFPYLARFGERVYRTGDLVRIFHDNTFDFLGRADDQVKLRGQRLEIGEINSVIKQSAGVSDVATLVLKHPKQQKEQLVSFIISTLKRDTQPRILLESAKDTVAAREACQQRLPGYMVPTHFVSLSSMPLSANNKADYRRLREMYEALSIGDLQLLSILAEEKEEDWSQDERKIARILRDFLQIEDGVKRSTNMFELGLDSISVIGFSRALKKAGFGEASASVVLKNDSVSRLANALVATSEASSDSGSVMAAQQNIAVIQHRHRRTAAAILRVDIADIEAVAPCTPLQQGMIARSLSSERGLYFNAFYFEIANDVDEKKLRNAWRTAFSSIQTLRTAFLDTDDGYVQAVCRNPTFPWSSFAMPGHDELSDRLEQLKKEWWLSNRTLLGRPFELHFVTCPAHSILAVHIFHALYDGISIDLLFERVWRIYNMQDLDLGGPSFLSALAYGPLRSCTGAKDFWEARIHPEKSRRLVTAEAPSATSVMVKREISALEGFQKVRRSLQVTPQAVVQACWATVLYTFLKGAVTLGVVTSGRSIDFEGAERVIGPMFNTIPYQHQLGTSETWGSIIKKTHEFNVATHPYQHTPLRDIMKWLNRKSDQPLFDILFVYQVAQDRNEWADNEVWKLQEGEPMADYPLAFEVEQNQEDVLKITLVADQSALEETAAQELLNKFEDSLRKVLDYPDAKVDSGVPDTGEVDIYRSIEFETNHAVRSEAVIKSDFNWTEPAIKLREVIATIAGTDAAEIKETTSIFELGLDSIDAIKLASRLRANGIHFRVSDIMRSRTIASMLTVVSGGNFGKVGEAKDSVFDIQKKRLEDNLSQLGVQPADVENILPATPLQEAMVAEMLASEYTEYYNHDVLKLATDVDVKKIQESLELVVKKSPILRTAFVEVEDPQIDCSYAQLVHRVPHDFIHYLKVESEPNLAKIIDGVREKAKHCGIKAPLFHVNIIESLAHTYLVLSISHALYDGWSLSLLHSDIDAAYHDRFNARPDYEPALREILNASGAEGADFWRDYLSDAKPSLFKRKANGENQSSQGVHRFERNSRITLADVSAFAKRNNITLQALGQTAYALVLATQVRSLDVTFGCVLSGRDNEQMSNILFPTMNTVAVRAILHGSRKDMLQSIQQDLLNIKPWQHFPLRKAQALAGAKGRLFESLFIYQKGRDVEEHGRTEKLYESVGGQSDVEYPVCVEMEVAGRQLIWRCAVKDEVFDAAGTEELLDALDSVMAAVLEQPNAPSIEFVSTGVSVGGLPAFQREDVVKELDNAVAAAGESTRSGQEDAATLTDLREVLALVSGIPEEEITKDMTIFHIGLDSISAIKVSAHLRKRGIKVSVRDMLKTGSIRNLAKLVQERRSTEEKGIHEDTTAAVIEEALKHIDQTAVLHDAGIKEVDVERILPITAGQLYMLSMWLNSRGTQFYPEFVYRVKGDVSFDTLVRSWQQLVSENPILRTSFVPVENKRIPWIQAVLRDPEVSVRDITGLYKEAMVRCVKECALQQPYAHLLASMTPTGWTLRLKIHHALYDGVSLPLLMHQFSNFCNGRETPVILQDTIGKFFAASASPSAQTQRKSFWTDYLHGVEPNHLPQPSSPPTSKTETFKAALLSDLSGLEALARSSGLSIQSFIIALYARIYASLTSTPTGQDVVIGVYLANRSHASFPDLAESPIPTVNLVPLRVNLPLQNAVKEVAAKVQRDMQDISSEANSGVGLREVWEWTGVKVDCFLNFLNLPDVEESATHEKESRGVQITAMDEWDKDVAREVKTESLLSVDEEKRLRTDNGRIADAYLHAIDVEITVRNGALDVGVFAPTEMLSLRGAEELVQELKSGIEALVEE